MHDVIIAGGGPAGSSAALLLARHGIRPLIVDRAAFPRTKACGEYINAGSAACLQALGIRDLKPHRLDGVRLSGHGMRVELNFSRPGWAIPRIRLDAALVDAALAAGAQMMTGRVEDVRISDDDVRLSVRAADGMHELQTRFLIGADGLQSIVARKCGLSRNKQSRVRFALGGHYAGFTMLDRFVEMFVDPDSYFAVNPFDEHHANVMVIVQEKDLAARREDVDSFIVETAERLSASAMRFSGATLEGRRIAIGPLSHGTSSLTRERVLLAGDAAGFVDPFTGQGIYVALRAGMLAAETVDGILRSAKQRSRLLAGYDAKLRREMVQREWLARLTTWVIGSSRLSQRVARKLQSDPARIQGLLDALTGCTEAQTAFRLSSLAALIV